MKDEIKLLKDYIFLISIYFCLVSSSSKEIYEILKDSEFPLYNR